MSFKSGPIKIKFPFSFLLSNTIPLLSIPFNFFGKRFSSKTTFLPTISFSSKSFAIPETTVLVFFPSFTSSSINFFVFLTFLALIISAIFKFRFSKFLKETFGFISGMVFLFELKSFEPFFSFNSCFLIISYLFY